MTDPVQPMRQTVFAFIKKKRLIETLDSRSSPHAMPLQKALLSEKDDSRFLKYSIPTQVALMAKKQLGAYLEIK